jgi:hypothetical protein
MLFSSALASVALYSVAKACTSFDVISNSIPQLGKLSTDHICTFQDIFSINQGIHQHSGTCMHPRPHLPKNKTSSTSYDVAPGPWTSEPTCSSNASETFCVFTSSSFFENRGISFVTKPHIGERIASLSAFSTLYSSHSSLSDNDTRDPPIYVASIPGRGMGVIANRTIERGDLIKAHRAIAIFHNDAVWRTQQDYINHYERLMKQAIDSLPSHSKEMLLNMAAHDETQEPYIEKIYTNSFGEDFGGEEHSIVVPETARLNHDCRPNAMYYFDRNTLTHYTHATRTIYAGEEITITYVDPLQTRKKRRAAIKRSWGFDCTCSLCMQGSQLVRESNRRVLQIKRLTGLLEEATSRNETERKAVKADVIDAPAMAELLISLYEQEKLSGSIADGYRLAALCHASVGNEWLALKWAMKAVEAGLIHDGPRCREVKDMDRILDGPRDHWSWGLNI